MERSLKVTVGVTQGMTDINVPVDTLISSSNHASIPVTMVTAHKN
jgi:hypothetical protein